MSAENEAALDRYEGFPTFYYKKEMERCRLKASGPEGAAAQVFVYIMHEDRPLGVPSGLYMETCGSRATGASGLTRRSWNGRMPTARRGGAGISGRVERRGTPASW